MNDEGRTTASRSGHGVNGVRTNPTSRLLRFAMQTSLRKSKISGPGQPQKLTKSNTKSSKDARKSKVGDKIKKRMSMRYADISAPTGGVPPMPAFNLQDLQASIQDETILHDPDDTFDDIKTIDTSVLQEENFDPDACT
jgi:hypothetical protein